MHVCFTIDRPSSGKRMISWTRFCTRCDLSVDLLCASQRAARLFLSRRTPYERSTTSARAEEEQFLQSEIACLLLSIATVSELWFIYDLVCKKRNGFPQGSGIFVFFLNKMLSVFDIFAEALAPYSMIDRRGFSIQRLPYVERQLIRPLGQNMCPLPSPANQDPKRAIRVVTSSSTRIPRSFMTPACW